jgi:hypothetical protein
VALGDDRHGAGRYRSARHGLSAITRFSTSSYSASAQRPATPFRGGATRAPLWPMCREKEWVRRPGASPPMRMTASWFRSWRTYRIQGCGAMFAPAGKAPPRMNLDFGRWHDGVSQPARDWRRARRRQGRCAPREERDGLRPSLTAAARGAETRPGRDGETASSRTDKLRHHRHGSLTKCTTARSHGPSKSGLDTMIPIQGAPAHFR